MVEPTLKASEVVIKLQELIEKHGDLECWYYDDCGEQEVHYVKLEKAFSQNAFFLF